MSSRAPSKPNAGPGLADELRIAAMRRRHLPGVMRIEKQVYPKPWTMSLYLGELALPSTRTYLVARLGNRVVGYGGLMMSLDEGHITTIAVDPNLQGHKLGTRLMLELCRAGVARGATGLTLEVRATNVSAQGLYRKFGFAPVGVRKNYYAEVGEDALVMWCHDTQALPFATRLADIEAALPSPTIREAS